MPQLGVLDGGGGGGGCGTAPPTLLAPGPLLGPGPVCWMRLQLPIASWDPPVPVEDVRLGAGTNEQLLDWEDEDGVAEFEEEEADDEEAVEAPAATAADIPPPFPPFPVPLPPPPMVES